MCWHILKYTWKHHVTKVECWMKMCMYFQASHEKSSIRSSERQRNTGTNLPTRFRSNTTCALWVTIASEDYDVHEQMAGALNGISLLTGTWTCEWHWSCVVFSLSHHRCTFGCWTMRRTLSVPLTLGLRGLWQTIPPSWRSSWRKTLPLWNEAWRQ